MFYYKKHTHTPIKKFGHKKKNNLKKMFLKMKYKAPKSPSQAGWTACTSTALSVKHPKGEAPLRS